MFPKHRERHSKVVGVSVVTGEACEPSGPVSTGTNLLRIHQPAVDLVNTDQFPSQPPHRS